MIGYGILIIFVLLFYLARNEKVIIFQKIPKFLVPFCKITIFLFYSCSWYWKLQLKAERVKRSLRLLSPNEKIDKSCKEYFLLKFAMLFFIIFVGASFSVLLGLTNDKQLMQGNIISKNRWEEGSKTVELKVLGEQTGIKEKIKYEILPEKYTDEELEVLYKDFLVQLEKEILGKNSDAKHIREDMNLITDLENYPFYVEWNTSDYTLINQEGKRKRKEVLESGEIVKLTAEITCEGFQRIFEYYVQVYPPILSETDQFLFDIEQEMKKSEEQQKYESYWYLPNVVSGEKVIWEEPKNQTSLWILMLAFLLAGFVFFQKDEDLKKQVHERERDMLWDYPSVVSRLTLYLNAGLTIRTAWNKIAKTKKGGVKNHYIYGEMRFTCYEMDSGISEIEAYEKFGKRCALQPYIKMTTLLVQNVRKGNSILLERLKEETQLALLERKNNIKIAAEEAETKLLLPMMLMLAVVMILIMVPALNSF